jgi:hypothetical protein
VLELTEENWVPFTLSLKNAIESQTTLADMAQVRIPIDLVFGGLDPFLASSALGIVQQLRNVTTLRVPRAAHLIRSKLAEAVALVVDGEAGRAPTVMA